MRLDEKGRDTPASEGRHAKLAIRRGGRSTNVLSAVVTVVLLSAVVLLINQQWLIGIVMTVAACAVLLAGIKWLRRAPLSTKRRTEVAGDGTHDWTYLDAWGRRYALILLSSLALLLLVGLLATIVEVAAR